MAARGHKRATHHQLPPVACEDEEGELHEDMAEVPQSNHKVEHKYGCLHDHIYSNLEQTTHR